MSYEGRNQFWCNHGHQWTQDEYYDERPENYNICPYCTEEAVFQNPVDDTNGMQYGLIQPVLVAEAVMKTCECCGVTSMVEAARYEIPTKDTPRLYAEHLDDKGEYHDEPFWLPVD